MSLPAENTPPEPMKTWHGDGVVLLGGVERLRHGVVHRAGEGVLLVGAREADDLHAVLPP